MLDTILRAVGVFGASDSLLFKTPISPWLIVLIGVGLVGLVAYVYRRTIVTVSPGMRYTLIGLKTLAIVLLVVCLLEPVALNSEVTPQQGFLLVLFDDSKSMSIQDGSGTSSRIDAVKRVFSEQALLETFGKRFKVRGFRFSSVTERLGDISELTAEGDATDIAGALDQAAGEFRDMPLAGIVLVSDGGDNASPGSGALTGATDYLKSQKVPVFSVGVGGNRIAKDIEILKVATSKTLTTGSITDLYVTIKSSGYEGRAVDLEIREGARLVRTENIRLGKDGDTQRIKLALSPVSPGIFEYTAEIRLQNWEMIVENNQRRFIIDNRAKTGRILYVEGYPRKEFKFIRRALEDDPRLKAVSMVRISPEGRLYRQGIQDVSELQEGYPRTRRELFTYDAIIFGDVEAAWFAPEQLKMTEEFVSVRGGGFLMLGGDQAFSEGGYAGTPIEDALPVRLLGGSGAWGSGVTDRSFRLQLTAEGLTHPLTQLGETPEENQQNWNNLPELIGYNRVGVSKPGATVLAVDPTTDALEGSNTILALQRYGRGRSMAITTASSWHWQMLMPSENRSHERFWQQMARWLALSTPGQVTVTLDKESYGEKEAVTITGGVFDETYAPVNEAVVYAHVTGPTGQTESVPLEWTFGEAGVYRAKYQPKMGGMHQVEVSVQSPESITARDQAGFGVATSIAEFTDPTLQNDVLKRLAESTGGVYVPLDQASQLPERIPAVKQMASTTRERDLRDTPPLFFAVVLILGLEWF
ncbi:MAG: hypothetical protein FJY97_20245, partial [candidate division Zixibacteria bacterium]|nr:hypothetical protein [candidate division Zixibacteria bacterium]